MVTTSGPTLTAVQKALISNYGMDERRILELARQYAVQSTINDTGMVLAAGFVGENTTFEMPADVKDRIERLVLHGALGDADRVFVEAIRDMGTFYRWKAAAERMEAFNSAVACLTATVPSYRRFLELRELDSYRSGVFLKDNPGDVDPSMFVSFTVGLRHAVLEKRRDMVDFRFLSEFGTSFLKFLHVSACRPRLGNFSMHVRLQTFFGRVYFTCGGTVCGQGLNRPKIVQVVKITRNSSQIRARTGLSRRANEKSHGTRTLLAVPADK